MEHHQPLSGQERLALWLRCLLRLGALLLIIWAVRKVLPGLFSLLLPFLLALLTAWLLNPAVKFLQKKCHLSRGGSALVAVLLTFALAGGGLTAVCYFLVREAVDLAQSLQSLFEELTNAFSSLDAAFDSLFKVLPPDVAELVASLRDDLLHWLGTAVPGFLSGLASRATDAAMGLPSFFIGLMTYLLGTFFLSSGWPVYLRRMSENLTTGGRQRMAALRTVTVTAFGGYLRAQLLLSLGVFVLLTAGFLLMKQPYALLLALLLAVLDFIPIVGSGTVMIPWGVIALLMGDFSAAVPILALWAVIALFRQIAEPRILGGQTGLSPILSLLSVYVGMRLYGVAGMILAPVLVLIVRNLVASGAADGLLRDAKLLFWDTARLWSGS